MIVIIERTILPKLVHMEIEIHFLIQHDKGSSLFKSNCCQHIFLYTINQPGCELFGI